MQALEFKLFNIYADDIFYGQLRAKNADDAVRRARETWDDDSVYVFSAELAAA